MLTADLIAKKRDGNELEDKEIEFLIRGFCDNSVADYQMSALAMAICLKGMTPRETAVLTRAMLGSGEQLPRNESDSTPRVDKHSTGGLGDKVSLILAPLLAACGVHVPMVSGRGLGLTGGTLDKLEAIDGFQANLDASQSNHVLSEAGAFIISAGPSIAPADRRLYALRDVTGTVESIPLITASILSKKLAANLDALVMDVKVGGGAFMKSIDDAKRLAASLRRVGSEAGLPTTTMITDMDQPLGVAVGNANEVNESLDVLAGRRREVPAVERVRELTVRLCADLLISVGVDASVDAATQRLSTALDNGSAMERFERMIAAQGGRLDGPLLLAPAHELESATDGCVAALDCHAIGAAVVAMGGGRKKIDDPIDHAVGVDILVRVGDRVDRGQPVARVLCPAHAANDYLGQLKDAVRLTDEVVQPRPLWL